jgi:PmbA protein
LTVVGDVAAGALAAVTEGDAEALAISERSGLARFASSEVHQPTLIENVAVTLKIVRDGRIGTAVTNRIDEQGFADLAARAGEAAESAVAEEDYPGLAPPATLPEVEGYDPAVAELGADDQARLARSAIEAADGIDVYGFFTSGTTEIAFASTTGVRAEQAMTDATTLVIAAADGMSGYAESSAWSRAGIDPAAVAREAAEKAAKTRGAETIEPGAYRAVLERYAVADLLFWFGFDAFSALGLLEERSYVTDKIGERVFDEKVSIADDALDPRGYPKAFDFEGTPKQRVELIEQGVARGVVWDRTSAARAGDGRAATGHAVPAPLRQYGALPFAISLAGGEAESVDELCELVGDGLYITRLHYVGIVHPREGVLTGMTRDGTFRIRDGKIAEPLVNLRFTVAVPQVFADVPGLSRNVELVNTNDFYGERYPLGELAPALATAHFNITGTGSEPGI